MKLRITLLAVAGATALISLPTVGVLAQSAEVIILPGPPPGPINVQYRSLQEPERYPTGSTRWWRSMDYEARGGAQ